MKPNSFQLLDTMWMLGGGVGVVASVGGSGGGAVGGAHSTNRQKSLLQIIHIFKVNVEKCVIHVI